MLNHFPVELPELSMVCAEVACAGMHTQENAKLVAESFSSSAIPQATM
jgi:hypothetical protein